MHLERNLKLFLNAGRIPRTVQVSRWKRMGEAWAKTMAAEIKMKERMLRVGEA